MSPPSGFFDLSSPELFFDAIRRTADDLKRSEFKDTKRLLFVIMGLNHLREWIAPGYRHKQPATSAAMVFYNEIFKLDAYKTIQDLCNGTKHGELSTSGLSTTLPSRLDDWPDIDSVDNFDCGPPRGYMVEGEDLLAIIAEVIRFYEDRWFSRQEHGDA